MATVKVRYIVNNVDESIQFYTEQLNFSVIMHPAPAFAIIERGELQLLLSSPGTDGGGAQPLSDGTKPSPGGWNRFHLEVNDLETMVKRLKKSGATFRNDIVSGVAGKQILLEDPSGNPIELFEYYEK